MGIFSDALEGFFSVKSEGQWTPWDDRWYESDLSTIGGGSPIGLTAETVLNCGVVLAAVRFRADIWSQSQPQIFRRIGRGRREEVEEHPLQAVLRAPCAWQTGVRWRHYHMMLAQIWGDSYSLIVGGRQTFASELESLHPSKTQVVAQRSDGMLVYEYHTDRNPQLKRVGQEQILHFRGPSVDGLSGLKTYRLIRNAVGIALLAEKHTTTFLRKGQRLAGFLVPKGDLGDEGKRKELADSVNRSLGGPDNTGTMGVLPFEVDFKPAGTTNKDAQLLELRDFEVGDILRFLGVPGVVVNWGEKTATFASAEAFFEEARRCVLPWIINFEAEEESALLPRDSGLQIKHNLDAVLRADTAKRYEALFKATGRAWITGNEARAIEDMNPVTDDPSMDKVAPPPNVSATEGGPPEPSPQDRGPQQRRPRPVPPEDDSASARREFAYELSRRTVRHELQAIRGSKGAPGAAIRYASDPKEWAAWARRFYGKHAETVAALPRMDEVKAKEYTDAQLEALLAGGIAAAETWEQEATPRLAALMLGE